MGGSTLKSKLLPFQMTAIMISFPGTPFSVPIATQLKLALLDTEQVWFGEGGLRRITSRNH